MYVVCGGCIFKLTLFSPFYFESWNVVVEVDERKRDEENKGK